MGPSPILWRQIIEIVSITKEDRVIQTPLPILASNVVEELITARAWTKSQRSKRKAKSVLNMAKPQA